MMIYSQNDLLKLILETRAVSIWDNARGPVFWYAANVPGPFYVNTEMVIGRRLSEHLLREITAIIVGTVDSETRANQLNALILDAYKNNPPWQKLIATMVDRAKREFPQGSFTMVSGGERRDWLFSIPFAYMLEEPHLFLFKNGMVYCQHPIKPGMTVLHVSDLINNAASFFDIWEPSLKKNQLGCCGNLCVNVRGENGLRRLREAGQRVVSLITIDVEFFRQLHVADLISRDVFEEIAVFFSSSRDWAAKYLIGKPELFNAEGCDEKAFERLRGFIADDPWDLRREHEAFFVHMQNAIHARVKKA